MGAGSTVSACNDPVTPPYRYDDPSYIMDNYPGDLPAKEALIEEANETPDEGARLRLSGARADSVWRQTCGVDVAAAPTDSLIYTRVAGVSCAILPEERSVGRSYQIWVDYSLAPDLWESLAECLLT